MEQSEDVSYPSEEMMIRLIEEQLWCGYQSIESSVRLPVEDGNATYLRQKVFPTLIPGLYDLVRREQRRISKPGAFLDRFQATGNTDPVTWLAQYLLRNNTHHSMNLQNHPYVLVNNEVLRNQKERRTLDDWRSKQHKIEVSMELDLEAVSWALEKLLKTSPANCSSPSDPSIKTKKPVLFHHDDRSTTKSSQKNDVIRSQKKSWVNIQKNNVGMNQDTQELLIAPENVKHCPERTCQKRFVGFVPSPNQILSKVIESSGIGASSILLSGDIMANKCQEDRVWTNILNQAPNPYVVLNSFPKNYSQKELVSHVAPTLDFPGNRVERIRDIVFSIAFDTIVHDSEKKSEVPIKHLILACSNNPCTGYVRVLCMKNIEGPVTRAVIPGSLMGPFIKVTLFPKNARWIKMVRVTAMELAFAESWTERHIIEEALVSSPEEDTMEDGANMTFSASRTSPLKAGREGGRKEYDSDNLVEPLSVAKKSQAKTLGSSSLVDSAISISPVESAVGDGESVLDSHDSQKRMDHPVPLRVVIPPVKTQGGDGFEEETCTMMYEGKIQKQKKKMNTSTMSPIGRENCGRVQRTSGSGGTHNNMLLSPTQTISLEPLSKFACNHQNSKDETYKPASHLLSSYSSDCSTVPKLISAAAEISRKHVSKALIAWGIKRHLLQDKNIMRLLREGRDENPHATTEFSFLRDQTEMRQINDNTSSNGSHEVYTSTETFKARSVWDTVTHWDSQTALEKLMVNSKSFSVTVARTSDEVIASLSQPWPLHVLFVLSTDAQNPVSSSDDSFNLMMTIARAQHRRGCKMELMFRIVNGFASLLHPQYNTNMELQWLLVLNQSYPASIKDWLLESLHVHQKNNGTPQLFEDQQFDEDYTVPSVSTCGGMTSLYKPAVLHSVLDFASLFEVLLPALKAWLTVSHVYYYGDVHPIFHPFINGYNNIIHPTNWFECNMHGTVRSVLLSLPCLEGSTVTYNGSDEPSEMPSTASRRLVCITLRKHALFSAVWQPHPRAVKVVVSNAHPLHHVHLLSGLLMDRADLTLAETLSPHMRSKYEVLDKTSSSIESTSSSSSPSGDEAASALAFHVLSVAFRHKWEVVGLSLSPQLPFDEDTFMDTVLRWAYAAPRVIVLFYMDTGAKDQLHQLSKRFLDAFAPVSELKDAFETATSTP